MNKLIVAALVAASAGLGAVAAPAPGAQAASRHTYVKTYWGDGASERCRRDGQSMKVEHEIYSFSCSAEAGGVVDLLVDWVGTARYRYTKAFDDLSLCHKAGRWYVTNDEALAYRCANSPKGSKHPFHLFLLG